jgi:hypothetical protein
LSDRLQTASTRLEAVLADVGQSLDGSSLERYVRITQRGDQFTEIENIEERLRHADRQESAAVSEIAGDGSRGILNLEWAGSFGFAWSSTDLRVTDRRDELQEQVERLYRTIREINGLLAGLRFGNSRFQFKVTPHRHAQELNLPFCRWFRPGRATNIPSNRPTGSRACNRLAVKRATNIRGHLPRRFRANRRTPR